MDLLYIGVASIEKFIAVMVPLSLGMAGGWGLQEMFKVMDWVIP